MGRKKKTLEEFIEMGNKVHRNKYSYDNAIYINVMSRITITCPEHGDFQQRGDHHIYEGKGCLQCANAAKVGKYNMTLAERNKEEWSQVPAIVYIIRCWDNNEDFIKIGITTKNTIKKRFKGIIELPYNWEEVRAIHTNLYNAIYEEHKLHHICEDHSYIPEMYFKGYTECFVDVPSEIKFGF